MQTNLGIQGIGFLSAWGHTIESFAENYRARTKALTKLDTLPEYTNAKTSHAGFIQPYNPKDYIAPKDVRRYDAISRFGIAASKSALDSTGRTWDDSEKENMGIVFSCESQGSITANYLDGLFREGPDLVSPKLFSVSAANSTSCNVSMETGIQGPSVNVASKFSAGFLSLFTSAQMIESGHVKNCLVGATDQLAPVLLEFFGRLNFYKSSETSKNGCYPGEGAAALILSRTESDCGKILGLGYTCSKQKNFRFPNDVNAHLRALRDAMGTREVHKFHAAANGDAKVDKLDRKAFEILFENARVKPEYVALKELLGEFSAIPLFQVIAACLEPKGTISLISTMSVGGTHGAVLVESTGWMEQRCRSIAS